MESMAGMGEKEVEHVTEKQKRLMNDVLKRVDREERQNVCHFHDFQKDRTVFFETLMKDASDYHLKALWVWCPLKMYPYSFVEKLVCPGEGCGADVSFQTGNWKTRKVFDLDDWFYLAYKRYKCKLCGGHFMNTDRRVLNSLPRFCQLRFPIILKERSAMTSRLAATLSMENEKYGISGALKLVTAAYFEKYERLRKDYLRVVVTFLLDDLKWCLAKFNEYTLLTEELKLKFQEANEISSKTHVPNIGKDKWITLNSLGVRMGESEEFKDAPMPTLCKYHADGIRSAFELASIDAEMLEDAEAVLLVGREDREDANRKKGMKRSREKAKTWVRNARLALSSHLRYHQNLEEVGKTLELQRVVMPKNKQIEEEVKQSLGAEGELTLRRKQIHEEKRGKYMQMKDLFRGFKDEKGYSACPPSREIIEKFIFDYRVDADDQMLQIFK
uniref:DUF6729 domain-containing protein n=1 Tax=Mucochytrium quahogii TaxID=96639 RepID=A0A7S2S0V7_9STRA|mmetsp:Transcript_30872/g.49506  ORF Transcript_30872/g.49506 Transcript_30872/m.49506 type:complete len:444 (+) Transcript_30872:377-1708(+)|eukprot:CAMPEP_0203757780 /NCGR_PEP_ID=MMETSP0098-20131031/10686_1 /ASSEMBLY_ACC=CAM_ASM_000208 /TAXON_ID=96639 /ORGANISM=" , Strain NY0313808BC1" /LENGTH=443 /DNA_ID=CAMNT_0050650013 /DNA_START=311 /DNA_END=1642 /DNA_ORIENTATION=+